MFVSVFDVWLELFDTQQSYVVTLAAIAIVAFGCTGTYIQATMFLQLTYIVSLWSETLPIVLLTFAVQQSSFYGYTGMLPKRYTQGVMTGESELNFHYYMTEIIIIVLE